MDGATQVDVASDAAIPYLGASACAQCLTQVGLSPEFAGLAAAVLVVTLKLGLNLYDRWDDKRRAQQAVEKAVEKVV